MAKRSNFALGAIIAAGAGYVAGLLTAPKSGARTRKDLGKKANKAKIQSEKQLKKLHSDLKDMIADGDVQVGKAKTKANQELAKALAKAKKSKEKARQLLSALHDGDVADPDLKKVLAEARKAREDLKKFLKK
jgi:gas vesicle protein